MERQMAQQKPKFLQAALGLFGRSKSESPKAKVSLSAEQAYAAYDMPNFVDVSSKEFAENNKQFRAYGDVRVEVMVARHPEVEAADKLRAARTMTEQSVSKKLKI
jgi:hypothetical protein